MNIDSPGRETTGEAGQEKQPNRPVPTVLSTVIPP